MKKETEVREDCMEISKQAMEKEEIEKIADELAIYLGDANRQTYKARFELCYQVIFSYRNTILENLRNDIEKISFADSGAREKVLSILIPQI